MRSDKCAAVVARMRMSMSELGRDLWFRLFTKVWTSFWMKQAGLSMFGRVATRLAMWRVPPHTGHKYLARLNPKGFISPEASIYHQDLQLGAHVFIDDRVLIFRRGKGGPIKLADEACILRDTIIETGAGGTLSIGARSTIHPRCYISAHLASITIGSGVGIAANCALYSYDHGFAEGEDISEQPLQSKGPITIGDGAWLGTGVIVLSGVTIGKGAVIGAGSVVTRDVPDAAVAAGVPARVLKMRSEMGGVRVETSVVEGK